MASIGSRSFAGYGLRAFGAASLVALIGCQADVERPPEQPRVGHVAQTVTAADGGGSGTGGGTGTVDAGASGAGGVGGTGGAGGGAGAGGSTGGTGGDACAAKLTKAEQGKIVGTKELKQGHDARYTIAAKSVLGGCGTCGSSKCEETDTCEWKSSDDKIAKIDGDCAGATLSALQPGNVAISLSVTIECNAPGSVTCKSTAGPAKFSKTVNINK